MSSRRIHPPLAAIATAVVALAGLAGCTGGGGPAAGPAAPPPLVRPGLGAFHTGTCRDGAATITAIGDLAARLRGAAVVPPPDETRLTVAQKALRRLPTSVELRQPVTDLVTAIGFVRIRIDGHSYDPQLMTDLVTAQQQVIARCVTPATH